LIEAARRRWIAELAENDGLFDPGTSPETRSPPDIVP
jgi:hypothetical protein